MVDLAKNNILQAKYSRIIALLSEKLGTSILEAMSLFYNSKSFELIQSGAGDLHCRSDLYLVDEIILEIEQKDNEK